MMRKMVASFLVVLFLILTIETFGLNIQIDHSLNISNSFGNEKTLEKLSLPFSFFVSQDIAVRLWGKINPFFYIFGEFHNTNVDTVIVTYLPWNVHIGTVQCRIPGGDSFSIMGITGQNFSVGQIRGNVKVVDFVVKAPEQEFFLGNVAYGSVYVYLNGFLLSSQDYTLNYTNGYLYVYNTVPGDIVTVRYQSLTNSRPDYILSMAKEFSYNNKKVLLGATFVSSTPTNDQCFLFSKLNMASFSITGWLNVEKKTALKMSISKDFSMFGMNSNANFYFNTINFREPLGLPQEKNVGLSVSVRNSCGNLEFLSDLKSTKIRLKNKNKNLFVQIGKEKNLLFKFSNKNLDVALNLGKEEAKSFLRVSNDSFSASFEKDLFSKNFSIVLNASTPLDLEASVSAFQSGIKVSKRIGNTLLSSIFIQNVSDLSREFVVNINGKMATPHFSWNAKFGFENHQSAFSLSSNLLTSLGNIKVDFESSQTSVSFNTNFEKTDMSLKLECQNRLFEISGSASRKIYDNWEGGMYVTVGMYDGKVGGTLKFKIWRNDF